MKLTDAEWILMNALWERHESTAREVAERLPPRTKWAYTTIKMMPSRLVKKGVLHEEKRGNVSFYRPLLGRRKARAAALRSLAELGFEGQALELLQFIIETRTLSASERDKLIAILEQSAANRSK